MKKIKDKIASCEIVKPGTPKQGAKFPEGLITSSPIDQMNEGIQRPELLSGTTYKIKPPTSDHALYVTINDITLNSGTDYEMVRPFEIFVNSKNMDQFQWVVALTRVISAVFRKGGDANFLVEELKSVFDPQGGYWKKGGKFMPSVVAEIGDVLEKHFILIGLLTPPELSEAVKAVIAEKKGDSEGFPESCTVCPKCHVKAVLSKDGCATCLDCGDSKCG